MKNTRVNSAAWKLQLRVPSLLMMKANLESTQALMNLCFVVKKQNSKHRTEDRPHPALSIWREAIEKIMKQRARGRGQKMAYLPYLVHQKNTSTFIGKQYYIIFINL